MLYRSICHQVSNQADKSALLVIILLLADVSPTYSKHKAGQVASTIFHSFGKTQHGIKPKLQALVVHA